MTRRKAKVYRLTPATLGIGQPVVTVVSALEELLDQANRGEILGFSVAYVDGANAICGENVAGCASANLMAASICLLHHRYMTKFAED